MGDPMAATEATALLDDICAAGYNIVNVDYALVPDYHFPVPLIQANRAFAYIQEHGATVVIPPKSNTKQPWAVDYYLYKERHLVECFFQKIKWFRRVATRFDKLDKSFLAFVYMAAIMIWLL